MEFQTSARLDIFLQNCKWHFLHLKSRQKTKLCTKNDVVQPYICKRTDQKAQIPNWILGFPKSIIHYNRVCFSVLGN